MTEKGERLGNTYEPLILPSEDKLREIWSLKYCKISRMLGTFPSIVTNALLKGRYSFARLDFSSSKSVSHKRIG